MRTAGRLPPAPVREATGSRLLRTLRHWHSVSQLVHLGEQDVPHHRRVRVLLSAPAPQHPKENPAMAELTTEQRARLQAMSQIGRPAHFVAKGPTTSTNIGTVVDEVSIISDHFKLMVQQIRHSPEQVDLAGTELAYRFCYYSFTADMKHIKFGQFALTVSAEELKELLRQARAKGWKIG